MLSGVLMATGRFILSFTDHFLDTFHLTNDRTISGDVAFQFILVAVQCHFVDAHDVRGFWRSLLAWRTLWCVRIILGARQAFVFDEPQALNRLATIATHVDSVTINDLLHRKSSCEIFSQHHAFGDANHSESVAGAAALLILDSMDETSCSPVNIVRSACQFFRWSLKISWRWLIDLRASQNFLLLFKGQIRFVPESTLKSFLSRSKPFIVSLDDRQVFQNFCLCCVFLLERRITFFVSVFPRLESCIGVNLSPFLRNFSSLNNAQNCNCTDQNSSTCPHDTLDWNWLNCTNECSAEECVISCLIIPVELWGNYTSRGGVWSQKSENRSCWQKTNHMQTAMAVIRSLNGLSYWWITVITHFDFSITKE